MKILIDEYLPERLKNYLEEFEVFTVSEMGWKSMKNGKLLNAAINNNFEIFLIIDIQLMHQQDTKSFNIAVIVFDIYRSKLELISPLVPKLKEIMPTLNKGTVTIIS